MLQALEHGNVILQSNENFETNSHSIENRSTTTFYNNLDNTLLFTFKNIVFFWPGLNVLIFLLIFRLKVFLGIFL